MRGSVCLTCKSKLERTPNYQFLEADQLKDLISGKLTSEEAAISVQRMLLNSSTTTQAAAPQAKSPADEIREFKQLLDEGLITEEEYEQVKAKILSR